LGKVGRQSLAVAFDAPPLSADAGLLLVRALERPLGILAELARRLPDPRNPQYTEHSTERLLTQHVYQVLAGYADANDCQRTRTDPLFQLLADLEPDPQTPLASGSTLNRFAYAFTRRHSRPDEPDRDVLRRHCQTERLKILNQFLVELFVRTRLTPPAEIILDIDATDDPVHGGQALAGYHGYYQQHQYFPLLVFEGSSGFPLACWLRHGTAHASLGAVSTLAAVVGQLRAAWPGVRIVVRGDSGLAVPAVLDYCEQEDLGYAFGYAANPVLERKVATATADIELYYRCYGRRDPHVQRYEEVRDYQSSGWPHSRRVVAKIERTPQGSQRRFVVTNLSEPAEWLYREFYVQRGAVPEHPIGELKNGLAADRLSQSGFCANAWRLLVHVLAYALVVLFRASCAGIEEVAAAAVGTLRQRLWKIPGLIEVSQRRVVVRLSAGGPGNELWQRAWAAIGQYVERIRAGPAVPAAEGVPM
jgi:hypothetical protein